MIEKTAMMKKMVPTELAVKVDDKYEVRYRELQEFFGYEFKVFPKDEGAEKAVQKIVSEMESQSYDHGACWRRVFLKEVEKEDKLDMYRFFVVKFRIRDSY